MTRNRMKLILSFIVCSLFCTLTHGKKNAAVFVEAESFAQSGGWVIDQQSMDVTGSPYLTAHGMGVPVADAATVITFPKKGKYHVFVRTRNWTGPWSENAAGKFELLIDGKSTGQIFGVKNAEWSWISGGVAEIKNKQTSVALHDLTGFNGRCDALYFTTDKEDIPPDDFQTLEIFRQQYDEDFQNPEEKSFDFVVIGGGMAGTCAAISAARLGVKVALVQNRPLLGGNNSSEVRVHLGARIKLEPYPELGNLVNEIGPEKGGNAQPEDYYEDDKKLNAVLDEPNISLFLNYHANEVETTDDKITKVYAENIMSGKRVVFSAPLFADCTGDGTIGYLAGAEYMTGRESRERFNEPTAPDSADNLTMGISVQWFAEKADRPISFPDIDWGLPWDENKSFAITKGDWDWETGMGKDMIRETEYIRDYGMLVVYSNWSFLKNHYSKKEDFADERLRWVAFIGGKRESRRLVGDYILTENDLINHRILPDGTAPTSWTIDLHYPDEKNSEQFSGQAFRSIAKHIKIYPYPIPYRCLYSKNIKNLLMAGRDISVSHVALGTVRLMRTGGMTGEVIGMAASVCIKNKVSPRDVYSSYFSELEKLMQKGVGNPNLPNKQTYNMGSTLMETEIKK